MTSMTAMKHDDDRNRRDLVCEPLSALDPQRSIYQGNADSVASPAAAAT
jgi:hypothetical protein